MTRSSGVVGGVNAFISNKWLVHCNRFLWCAICSLALKSKFVLLFFVGLDPLGLGEFSYPRIAYFMSKGEGKCDVICVDKSMSRIFSLCVDGELFGDFHRGNPTGLSNISRASGVVLY